MIKKAKSICKQSLYRFYLFISNGYMYCRKWTVLRWKCDKILLKLYLIDKDELVERVSLFFPEISD